MALADFINRPPCLLPASKNTSIPPGMQLTAETELAEYTGSRATKSTPPPKPHPAEARAEAVEAAGAASRRCLQRKRRPSSASLPSPCPPVLASKSPRMMEPPMVSLVPQPQPPRFQPRSQQPPWSQPPRSRLVPPAVPPAVSWHHGK